MSLEIKQLVIKSEIKDKNTEHEQVGTDISCQLDELKIEILNQCRRMVSEQLKKTKER
jgi:hypothetical protein